MKKLFWLQELGWTTGADPGEVKFHPPFSETPLFFFLIPQILMLRPQTPQPGFGSITLLQKLTPHFKILDPRLDQYFSYRK